MQTKYIPVGFQGTGYKKWLASSADGPEEAEPFIATDKAPLIAQGHVPPALPLPLPLPAALSEAPTTRDVEMQQLQAVGDLQRSPQLATSSPGQNANGQVAVSSF